jgi:hypothetical protein
MTSTDWTALITALVSLISGVTALIRAEGTRAQLTSHEVQSAMNTTRLSTRIAQLEQPPKEEGQ